MRVVKAGTTDVSVVIRIIDSTDGTPETGVVWNTAGIDLQYRREDAASTAITEATLALLASAHADGGFIHIGNGYYRFDLPDAACAAGEPGVLVHGTVTGMVVIGEYIQLVAYDPFDTVRLGLTAMPNAAANAVGGLPVSDAGGLDLDNRMISAAATIALEDQYDGTGLFGDAYPLRQDQGASISGGLAVKANMTSVTVVLGSQQDLSNANASNNTRWTGDDDGAGAEFIFLCTPADTTAEPGDLHFEGYYDEPSGASNGATLSVYNFQTAAWDAHVLFSNSGSDETHEFSLTHANGAPGSGTLEGVAYTIGDVLIKFEQDTQETGNACLLIDRMYVGFISSALTQAEITGGAYALDTDNNGRIRIVDGTAAGELALASGKVDVSHLAGFVIQQSGGYIGINWAQIRNPSSTQDLSGTTVSKIDTVNTGGITAASIADGAIDNATFAADVGTTVYASNTIALAVRKALDNYDGPTDTEMVAAFTEIKGATWAATDTLEAIRNRGDTDWKTATGFSTHDAAAVVTALGTGSTLTACATATGFSTHDAAAVVTALGTGSTLTDCLTATGFSTHDAAAVVTALGTGSTLTDCATATGFAVAGDAMALTEEERNAVSDVILGRSVSNIEATADEHSLCTIVLACLESSISGTTWTINRTDGTTEHASKTVATDADANPITSVS